MQKIGKIHRAVVEKRPKTPETKYLISCIPGLRIFEKTIQLKCCAPLTSIIMQNKTSIPMDPKNLFQNLNRLSYIQKQDKVLNGLGYETTTRIAESGLNPLINPIIRRYEKLVQKFSNALLP